MKPKFHKSVVLQLLLTSICHKQVRKCVVLTALCKSVGVDSAFGSLKMLVNKIYIKDTVHAHIEQLSS